MVRTKSSRQKKVLTYTRQAGLRKVYPAFVNQHGVQRSRPYYLLKSSLKLKKRINLIQYTLKFRLPQEDLTDLRAPQVEWKTPLFNKTTDNYPAWAGKRAERGHPTLLPTDNI